ncbi:MAG: DMT family transporter, partial [Anaerolineales bacterium]
MSNSPSQNRNHPQDTSIPPLTVVMIGILAASTSSIFIRFAQQEADSIVIASYRLGLATLILMPWALWRNRVDFTRLQTREWLLTLAAGVCLGAHFGTWISSLAYTNVTSSVVLVQTSPLFVMLLSPLFLQEPPSRRALLGLLLALLGGLAIALSDTWCFPANAICLRMSSSARGTALKGDLLAVAGAISGALYLIAGRSSRKTIPLVPYITLVYGIASLTLLTVALISHLPLRGFSRGTYLWFLLLAIFPQLLAHSNYNWALKFLPATT